MSSELKGTWENNSRRNCYWGSRKGHTFYAFMGQLLVLQNLLILFRVQRFKNSWHFWIKKCRRSQDVFTINLKFKNLRNFLQHSWAFAVSRKRGAAVFETVSLKIWMNWFKFVNFDTWKTGNWNNLHSFEQKVHPRRKLMPNSWFNHHYYFLKEDKFLRYLLNHSFF